MVFSTIQKPKIDFLYYKETGESNYNLYILEQTIKKKGKKKITLDTKTYDLRLFNSEKNKRADIYRVKVRDSEELTLIIKDIDWAAIK